MNARSRLPKEGRSALDGMLRTDEKSAVPVVGGRLFDPDVVASLDCLDLFHNLPVSEQGWGKEVVDYE